MGDPEGSCKIGIPSIHGHNYHNHMVLYLEPLLPQTWNDEAAVFSCMAYVDLNPVRAKTTEKLEESDNTSIKKRINKLKEIN